MKLPSFMEKFLCLKLRSFTLLTIMDVGVSRFWKSPPPLAAQVDICRPTWQHGWGGEGMPVGRLSKNVLEVFHHNIANLARYRKCIFCDLGPKYRLIPSGPIWANVRQKLLMGRLTVLPNDEEMLLTDLSSKVRKKF